MYYEFGTPVRDTVPPRQANSGTTLESRLKIVEEKQT